jgi:hypothetical protein
MRITQKQKKNAEIIIDTALDRLNLSDKFSKHCGRDAIELVPFDKYGIPFDKWKGIQLSMSLIGDGKKLILAEDSNNDMLIKARRVYQSFNLAVGNQLPIADDQNHIDTNLLGIDDFKQQMQLVAALTV